jgi:nucleoside-diphosphate-sugar epimerase
VTGVPVVLDAGGALGSALVRQYSARGERVRAAVRVSDRATFGKSVEVAPFDALNPRSVASACRGASTVFHCVDVAYEDWRELAFPILGNVLDGLRGTGALLVFPGAVLGYGPFQSAPAKEEHPLAATSRKGRLRNAMERRLWAAHRSGEVRVVVPRLPDVFGPEVTSHLMAHVFKAALSGRRAVWYGSLDVPHDLVFVEDAAAACLSLARRPSTYGQSWHVPGPGPITGRAFLELAFRAAAKAPRLGLMRRGAARLAGFFVPTASEMVELLYEFEQPLVLDGQKIAKELPDLRYTPHPVAVERTVAWFRDHAN